MIKTLTLTVIGALAIASSVFAGANDNDSQDHKSMRKVYKTSEYYRAGETQVDVFGNYSHGTNDYRSDRYLKQDHAFGGAVGVNHFFTRNLGVGIDGSYINTKDKTEQATANVIYRQPIGESRFAPYTFVGGGAMFGSGKDTRAVGHAGAGIEYRVSPNVGIKTDYSYNVVDGPNNNFGMIRTGVSISF